MSDAEKTVETFGVFGQIIVFAIKTCIVSVIITACVLYVADTAIETLQDSVEHTVFRLREQLAQTPIGGRQFWSRIEEELDRAADPSSDLSPEKKQKIVRDVRLLVARWRPFIDAAQSEMQKPVSAN